MENTPDTSMPIAYGLDDGDEVTIIIERNGQPTRIVLTVGDQTDQVRAVFLSRNVLNEQRPSGPPKPIPADAPWIRHPQSGSEVETASAQTAGTQDSEADSPARPTLCYWVGNQLYCGSRAT